MELCTGLVDCAAGGAQHLEMLVACIKTRTHQLREGGMQVSFHQPQRRRHSRWVRHMDELVRVELHSDAPSRFEDVCCADVREALEVARDVVAEAYYQRSDRSTYNTMRRY